MAEDCADCGLKHCEFELAMIATSDPLKPQIRRQIRSLRGTWRGPDLSGASGAKFEAIPGPARF
eukprot:9702207-Alexandrium_andersonii.AAC.2